MEEKRYEQKVCTSTLRFKGPGLDHFPVGVERRFLLGYLQNYKAGTLPLPPINSRSLTFGTRSFQQENENGPSQHPAERHVPCEKGGRVAETQKRAKQNTKKGKMEQKKPGCLF